MDRFGLTVASVVLVLWSTGVPPRQPVPTQEDVYARFMSLSLEQRHERFRVLSPEHKALIVRTHAEGWLSENRTRLTDSELKVFEEIIAFITPERYRPRANAAATREEQALTTKMICRVDPDDVMRAFSVLRPPPPASQPERWTYLHQATCWIRVIAEELVDYLPLVRR